MHVIYKYVLTLTEFVLIIIVVIYYLSSIISILFIKNCDKGFKIKFNMKIKHNIILL